MSIAKKYANLDESLKGAEILSELGIEQTVNELFIKGPLVLKLEGKILDLSGFKYGVGLNTKTLINSEIIGTNFENILIIENKFNFIDESESREGWLLVFSDGYYSPSKRAFLKRIGDYLEGSGRGARYFCLIRSIRAVIRSHSGTESGLIRLPREAFLV